MVVEGGDDDGGVGAANGGLDVGGRHFEVGVVDSRLEVSMAGLSNDCRLEVVDSCSRVVVLMR